MLIVEFSVLSVECFVFRVESRGGSTAVREVLGRQVSDRQPREHNLSCPSRFSLLCPETRNLITRTPKPQTS